MRFKGLDLNLIVALNVLLEERNVTRSAQRLHLSQPAVSGALSRLRDYFNDDLIVSVGRKMVPTARGEQLFAESQRLIDDIDRFIASDGAFTPETTVRRFRISASDYAIEVLLASIVGHLAKTAPGLRFEFVPPGPRAAKGFQNGDIDAMILPGPYVQPEHPAHLLYTDCPVVMGWNQNAALKTSITKAELLSLQHVVIDIGEEPHRGFHESQFRELHQKIKRSVVVPSFHTVPRLLVGTDRVAIMHRKLAELQLLTAPLKIVDNPFEFEAFEEWLQVHNARQHEPALAWLVNILSQGSLKT